MKFTIEIDPEDFGKFLVSIPPEVRQQFIDSAIKAYPMMIGELMKSSGVTFPDAQTFNPADPFGVFKVWTNMFHPKS